MKIHLLLATLLFTLASTAQIHDLATMAEGDMIFSDIVYENDGKVFGYMYLFQRDIEKGKRTVEYVFLDKNLNKASNGTFDEPHLMSKVFSYGVSALYRNCSLMGDSLVLTKGWYTLFEGTKIDEHKGSTFQFINLKTNEVSPDMYARKDSLLVIPQASDLIKKPSFTSNTKTPYSINTNTTKGLLYYSNYGWMQMHNLNGGILWHYNPDSCKLLSTTVDTQATLFKSSSLRLIGDSSLYFIVTGHNFNTHHYTEIRKFNLIDGQLQWVHLLETRLDDHTHSLWLREHEGNLYIMGAFAPNNKRAIVYNNKLKGLYTRVVSDKGQLIHNKYYHWDMLSGDLPISSKGKVDKKFNLVPMRFFIFKNGSVSLLAKKIRPEFNSKGLSMLIPIGTIANSILRRPPTYGDFVFFNFTPELEFKNTLVVKKELMKSWDSNDYLFSHYTRNDEGMVFYYTDEVKNPETKKKELQLGIVNYDGEQLNEERIPLFSPNKYLIIPFPAKEGYVMLNERNEKDKYNQIRLEKLNF